MNNFAFLFIAIYSLIDYPKKLELNYLYTFFTIKNIYNLKRIFDLIFVILEEIFIKKYIKLKLVNINIINKHTVKYLVKAT